MALSSKTLSRLAGVLERTFTHAQLDTLFLEYGVRQRDPTEANANKLRRSVILVDAVRATREEKKATQDLLELAGRTLFTSTPGQEVDLLRAALRVDGFEWTGEELVPSEPGQTPLAPELTALERRLQQMGFNVAATHYRQAVDNFTDGNFEACNGQLRSFQEDLVREAARRHGQQQTAGVDVCLQHLRNSGRLDAEEWNIFRSLWNGIQNNGPHAGLTTEEEARFRLHMLTAAGRYLLIKIA